MCRVMLSLMLVPTLASLGAAQTKISGTSQCPQPDPQHAIQVGDNPDHAFSISKVKCTWAKPLEIAGLKTTVDEITGFSEVSGNSSTDRGFVVGNTSNGDKLFVRTQGKTALKDGRPQLYVGTWTYTGTGGTGKLKGIQGKGTVKCTWNPSGIATCGVAGKYHLPK
jgi:hypothetical protein